MACCRGIPYSRRFRSVKAGACASAASLMIPLLPAIAGFSLPVPGVQLSSITIGRTMYCCLPSTCKKNVPESWGATKQQQKKTQEIPASELLLCGAKDVSIMLHGRKGETQLKFYLISGYARTKAGRRTLSLPCLSRRVAKSTRQKTKRGERDTRRARASAKRSPKRSNSKTHTSARK